MPSAPQPPLHPLALAFPLANLGAGQTNDRGEASPCGKADRRRGGESDHLHRHLLRLKLHQRSSDIGANTRMSWFSPPALTTRMGTAGPAFAAPATPACCIGSIGPISPIRSPAPQGGVCLQQRLRPSSARGESQHFGLQGMGAPSEPIPPSQLADAGELHLVRAFEPGRSKPPVSSSRRTS